MSQITKGEPDLVLAISSGQRTARSISSCISLEAFGARQTPLGSRAYLALRSFGADRNTTDLARRNVYFDVMNQAGRQLQSRIKKGVGDRQHLSSLNSPIARVVLS